MKSMRDIRDEMSRRGSIVVLAAVFMIVILAFCSFTIDFGYIMLVDQEMQAAVDSAALAAAQELQIAPDGGQGQVVNAALDLAARNTVDGQNLTLERRNDVEIGTWDELTGSFSAYTGADMTQANAVRVTGRLTDDRQNAVNLFFAPIFGQRTHQVADQAIAVIGRTKMRDVMLVIDCSGSMSSYSRMTMTRAAAQILVDELGEDDRLGLAVYSYPVLVNNGSENDNNTGRGNAGSLTSTTSDPTGAGTQIASVPNLSDGISAQFRSSSRGSSSRGSTSRGSTSRGSTSRGSTSRGSTSRGSTSRGSTSRGSTSRGSTSRGSTSRGSTSRGSTSRGSTSRGSTSRGSTSRGSTSRGSTSRGSTSRGSSSRGNNNNNNNNGGNNGGETRLSGRLEKQLMSNFQPVRSRIPQLRPNLYASTTCIGGGMRVAIQEFIANPRLDPLGNKVEQVMVLMTDGQANETEPPGTNPINSIYYYANLARENDIIIHGITLGRNAQSAAIKDSADTTGGEYHHVNDGDFDGLFEVYRGLGRGGKPRLVR